MLAGSEVANEKLAERVEGEKWFRRPVSSLSQVLVVCQEYDYYPKEMLDSVVFVLYRCWSRGRPAAEGRDADAVLYLFFAGLAITVVSTMTAYNQEGGPVKQHCS